MNGDVIVPALKAALGLVGPSVATKKALSDAIRCIKVDLSPEDKMMTLTASNLEQTSRAEITYNGQSSGSFLIDSDAMKSLLKLQGTHLDLSLVSGSINIQCDRVHITIPTRDATAFPDMTESFASKDVWMTEQVSTSFIENSILSVAHCAGKDASRPALMAIKFVNESGVRVKTYATDGHRMTIASVQDSPLPSMLLPTSAIKAIQRSIKNTPACHIGLATADTGSLIGSKMKAFALSGGFDVDMGEDEDPEPVEWMHSFRLQNDTGFPDLENVWKQLSSGERLTVEIDIAPVRSALSLAGMFDKEHNRMRLSFTDDELVINAGSDKGTATIGLSIIGETPEALKSVEIGVNGRYLMEALGSSLEDSVKLMVDKDAPADKPVLIKSASKKEMIMPMRL